MSAVALMISGTANATTDYAEVTAKATIQVAGSLDCTDLNFGTIVVKQNNADISLPFNEIGFPDDYSSDILSISGIDGTEGVCLASVHSGSEENISVSETVTLTGTTNPTNKMTVLLDAYEGIDDGDGYKIVLYNSILQIPAKVQPDTYTGSFTVSFTY